MAEPENTEPTPFDDLPLRVQVLFGECEVTLADARKLTAGSVLDLRREPGEPVRLAVNGRLIGSGELVDIEGHPGVRILEWSKR